MHIVFRYLRDAATTLLTPFSFLLLRLQTFSRSTRTIRTCSRTDAACRLFAGPAINFVFALIRLRYVSVPSSLTREVCFLYDQPPLSVLNTEKAGSKRGQQAVKLSLQQQIDRSRATAKEYDQAYSRDVEVIKSIEESLISVFNKARRSAGSYVERRIPFPPSSAVNTMASGKGAASIFARVYGMLRSWLTMVNVSGRPPSCYTVVQVGSTDKAASKQLTAMGVTDRNILLFLAQIEEQIDYIVQASGEDKGPEICSHTSSVPQ